MGWLDNLRTVFLNALFPRRCAGCRQIGDLWCARCQASVAWLRPPLCPKCGYPQQHEQVCGACRRAQPKLDGIRSAALFEGPLRQAIHELKYSGQKELAGCLGSLLESFWVATPLPVDVIVPVPLHAARLRERGYNQAALLAGRLSKATGIPLVEDCLVRTRVTTSQMTLKAAERRINVKDAFGCSDKSLAGQRVVVVDDVCTTGATLEACGEALFQAGVVSVWALTLARAV